MQQEKSSKRRWNIDLLPLSPPCVFRLFALSSFSLISHCFSLTRLSFSNTSPNSPSSLMLSLTQLSTLWSHRCLQLSPLTPSPFALIHLALPHFSCHLLASPAVSLLLSSFSLVSLSFPPISLCFSHISPCISLVPPCYSLTFSPVSLSFC